MRRTGRRWLAAAGVVAGTVLSTSAAAGAEPRVDVVAVSGILDGTQERAIVSAIRSAERERAQAIVIQIDSVGGFDTARLERLTRAVRDAHLPVVTWVGPPGARAANSALALAWSADVVAMAPGSSVGPVRAIDVRDRAPDVAAARRVLLERARSAGRPEAAARLVFSDALPAGRAEDAGAVDLVAIQLPDLLDKLDGRTVMVGGSERALATDPDQLTVTFKKGDLWGRLLHAAAKPSVAYLVLLIGLVGVVFEIFHPSTGPAGICGLLGLALAGYAVATLGASWLGVALIVGGIAAMCVDLRVEGFGLFSLAGIAGLIVGSVLLFPSPWMRASPWVLSFGAASMIAFMVGAMTRVLRDLRALARGEIAVQDPHPH